MSKRRSIGASGQPVEEEEFLPEAEGGKDVDAEAGPAEEEEAGESEEESQDPAADIFRDLTRADLDFRTALRRKAKADAALAGAKRRREELLSRYTTAISGDVPE